MPLVLTTYLLFFLSCSYSKAKSELVLTDSTSLSSNFYICSLSYTLSFIALVCIFILDYGSLTLISKIFKLATSISATFLSWSFWSIKILLPSTKIKYKGEDRTLVSIHYVSNILYSFSIFRESICSWLSLNNFSWKTASHTRKYYFPTIRIFCGFFECSLKCKKLGIFT